MMKSRKIDTDLFEKDPIEKLNTLKACVRTNSKKVIPELEALLESDYAKSNVEFYGEIHYLLGDAYFELSHPKDALEHLSIAYDIFEKHQDWENAIHAQSFIGLTFMEEGNLTYAMISFSKELQIAETHHIAIAYFKAYSQLGQCFLIAQDFDKALEYFLKADEVLHTHPEIFHQTESVPIHYCLVVIALCILGRVDEAKRTYQKQMDCMKDYPRLRGGCYEIIPASFITAYETNALDIHDEMPVIQRDMEENGNVLIVVMELLDLLTKFKQYDEALDIAKTVNEIVDHTDYYQIKLATSKYKSRIYEERENYYEALQEQQHYIQLADEAKKIELNSSLTYLKMSSALEKSSRENEILKNESLTDPLTKLANRRKLAATFHTFYQNAKSEQKLLSVTMIDIDLFKDVNDYYGHLKGDQCLCMLADILHKHESGNVFTARYGGDEFSILWLGIPEEDIQKKLHDISEDFTSKCRKNIEVPVTLSQGTYSNIPHEELSEHDYFRQADKILYIHKRHAN